MKTILAVLLLSSICYADTSQNPDRYPSIGVDYTQTQMTLNLSNVSYYGGDVFTISDPSQQVTTDQITFDFKAPISNEVTFDMHGGPNSIHGLGTSEKGYSIGISGRLYLPELQ